MKNVVVFLASSDELIEDRRAVGDLFQFLNNIYTKRGVYLRLETWKYESAAIVNGRKQEEYNQLIRNCDLCFFLFFTKAGQYALEEFDTALAAFRDVGKPKILTYFREIPDGQTADDQLLGFLHRLDAEMNHYWSAYGTIDTLKLGIIMQIKLSGVDAPIEVKDDQATVAGQALVDLRNVPSYRGMSNLTALRSELADIEPRYFELKARYQPGVSELGVSDVYPEIATRRTDLLKQISQAEQDYLSYMLDISEHMTSGEQLSARQVQAYRFFEQGQVAEALKILDEEELRLDDERRKTEFDAAQAIIDQAQSTLDERKQASWQQSVNTWLQRYETLKTLPVTPDVLTQEETSLRTAYDIEIRNNLPPNAAFELGDFLSAQNRSTDALTVREALKSNPLFDSDQNFRAKTLNRLGTTYQKLHYYDQAEAACTEAVAVCRELARLDKYSYESSLASCLQNLGVLYQSLHRYNEAVTTLIEATTLWGTIAESDPDNFREELIRSILYLGSVCMDQHQYSQAEFAFNKAVTYYRELATTSPDAYKPKLAEALNSLGVVNTVLHHYDQAEVQLTEALTLCEGLAHINPDAYLPVLAETMYNFGGLYLYLGQYDQSETILTKALALYRQLAKSNPDAYTPDLARALFFKGVLGKDRCSYDHAEAMLIEALTLYRELAKSGPLAYTPDLAVTLYNLGILYNRIHRYDEAESVLIESLAIRRELAQANSDAYTPDLAVTLGILGALYRNWHRDKQAEPYYAEAVVLYRQLARTKADVYAPNLAATLYSLGTLYSTQLQHMLTGETEAVVNESVTLYRDLAKANPDAYSSDLSSSLNLLGIIYIMTRNWPQAQLALAEAVDIKRRLIEVDPDTYKDSLANSLKLLIKCVTKLGQKDDARKLKQELKKLGVHPGK